MHTTSFLSLSLSFSLGIRFSHDCRASPRIPHMPRPRGLRLATGEHDGTTRDARSVDGSTSGCSSPTTRATAVRFAVAPAEELAAARWSARNLEPAPPLPTASRSLALRTRRGGLHRREVDVTSAVARSSDRTACSSLPDVWRSSGAAAGELPMQIPFSSPTAPWRAGDVPWSRGDRHGCRRPDLEAGAWVDLDFFMLLLMT
jgi:hypothetical protein